MARLLVFACAVTFAASAQTRMISSNQLHDKIAGGWAGQMIGVSFGAPTEFRTLQKINEGEFAQWTPDAVKEALDQDDLYVDMTFAKVLDDKGLDATTEDFGAMFRDAKYRLWHANLAARRALKRGVPATLTGTPRYNVHANDIDFQIEADFVGLMAPGMPQSSNQIAARAGRVMNYGDGIYGGMYISCMYSAAFFEKDPRAVVEAGLACIPAQSPYGQLIHDVLLWSKQNPNDWKRVWQLIADKWDRREPCPEGALKPFNIDAKLNGAYLTLGLLYGERDFTKTIEIATRSGQDSDCNPASAAGILGVMLGYDAIPAIWKGGIPALADQKFNYTDFTFHTIVASTEKRAIALALANGGKLSNGVLTVKMQKPAPAKLEIWDDYGEPISRIPVNDARWKFQGEWTPLRNGSTKAANAKGAEAAIEFTGTGFIMVGLYQPTGGRYDLYLDGTLDGTLDSNSDESNTKNGESIWHKFGLTNGKHSLRLVVRGEPFQDHTGSDVALSDLVVFAPKPPPNAVVANIPVNYDEANVGSYVLPDLLKNAKDTKSWMNQRRPEIDRLVAENQFGKAPPKPDNLSFEVFEKSAPAFDGKAIRRQITVHIGTKYQWDVLLYLPANSATKPAPVLLNASFSPNATTVDDPGVKRGQYWNREQKRVPAPTAGIGRVNPLPLIEHGIGFATVYYGDIDPDFAEGLPNGVRALYPKPAADEWGTISAWAWGLSRVMDYLETDSDVDAKHVALMGISRLGKTVLWAGGHDTRFAAVIASCSGEGGAALYRRNYGETLHHMAARYGYQFAENYAKYGERVNEYPVDAHMLVSLMAPRPLLLQTGDSDYWSDPKGEFLAAQAAAPAYRLLGQKVVLPSEFPGPGEAFLEGNLNYYMHAGGHGTIPSDWYVFLRFLDAHLH